MRERCCRSRGVAKNRRLSPILLDERKPPVLSLEWADAAQAIKKQETDGVMRDVQIRMTLCRACFF